MTLQQCFMCKLFVRSEQFLRHIVRIHKYDPNFKIYCQVPTCGASYTKWKSYVRHIKRKHNITLSELAENPVENSDYSLDIEIARDITTREGTHESNITDQPDMTFENIKKNACTFILGLTEQCLLSESTIDAVINGVENLLRDQFAILQNKVLEGQNEDVVSVEYINQKFQELNTWNFFESVRLPHQRENYMRTHRFLVSPEKVELGKVRQWTKNKEIIEVGAFGYIVPFLPSLEAFLNNDDVLSCVNNPRPYVNDFYSTILDGEFNQKHEIFQRNRNALSIILYYDDVEFCNPLGSKSRKLAMVYWSLGNIYPELRSTIRTVNLLAVVPSSYFKKFGPGEVLKSFIKDLNCLSSPEGVLLNIKGRSELFSGFLHFVAGDTPASSLLGGFKESVGSANRPCRTCLVTKTEMCTVSSEDDVVLREKNNHQEYVEIVTNKDLTPQARVFWSKYYGINTRSCLSNNIDETKQIPHDAMHVILEGTLEAECRNFINFCITAKLFSLEDLNTAIKCFDYQHMSKNKPSQIEEQHLHNKLKQSAAQMLTLGYVLPFLVYQWLNETADDHLNCFISHIQIINLALSFELSKDDALFLKKIIEFHHALYVQLYGEAQITPKFHYLIHLPSQILLFGPIRQQWCFRFEAAHQYFKNIAARCKNFKNLPKTFSYRAQKLKCIQLCSGVSPYASQTFLYYGDNIRYAKSMKASEHEFFESIIPIVGVNSEIIIASQVQAHNAIYSAGTIILVSCYANVLPCFGRIIDLIVFKKRIFLLYSELKTVSYNERLNAYKIQSKQRNPASVKLLLLNDLTFSYPLSEFKCMSEQFVILQYHRRCEFMG